MRAIGMRRTGCSPVTILTPPVYFIAAFYSRPPMVRIISVPDVVCRFAFFFAVLLAHACIVYGVPVLRGWWVYLRRSRSPTPEEWTGGQ